MGDDNRASNLPEMPKPRNNTLQVKGGSRGWEKRENFFPNLVGVLSFLSSRGGGGGIHDNKTCKFYRFHFQGLHCHVGGLYTISTNNSITIIVVNFDLPWVTAGVLHPKPSLHKQPNRCFKFFVRVKTRWRAKKSLANNNPEHGQLSLVDWQFWRVV